MNKSVMMAMADHRDAVSDLIIALQTEAVAVARWAESLALIDPSEMTADYVGYLLDDDENHQKIRWALERFVSRCVEIDEATDWGI